MDPPNGQQYLADIENVPVCYNFHTHKDWQKKSQGLQYKVVTFKK